MSVPHSASNASIDPTSATSATSERDERLARVLDEMTAHARRGGQPDVESEAARHPDLAQELRQLWAAVQFTDAFVASPHKKDKTAAPAGPASTGSLVPANDSAEIQARADQSRADQLPRTFGDYELLIELGRGGMGIVYKAWEHHLYRLVALKMILRGIHATSADLARFESEARAAAHLDHPHIVPVYAAGVQDGQAYLAMRYVEGETLSTLLTRGPLRSREAARLLATIARAVHFAHERGILHRDLKPSNVLLDREGVPHISDFGLAKYVPPQTPFAGALTIGTLKTVGSVGATGKLRDHSLTQSGALIGTPAYMAPEQVSGRRGRLSAASDVYSLGIILYEMLTGRPPFQAPTPVDTLLLVLDQDPVRPALLNPKVEPDLELISLKCIQKDPGLRYQSAAALADDLEAYLNNETLSVRSGSFANLSQVITRLLRATHNAIVLENWGLLWIIHSIKILLQCVATTAMSWSGVTNPLWYLLLWGGGLIVWGTVFWSLRKRAGPVLFIERQVAHVWAGAVVCTIGIFVIEMLLGLDVLTLTPMLAVVAGMAFLVKAGMFSGEFYIYGLACFIATVPIALFPDYGALMFGLVAGLGFFVPGLRYHLQRRRSVRNTLEDSKTPAPVAAL